MPETALRVILYAVPVILSIILITLILLRRKTTLKQVNVNGEPHPMNARMHLVEQLIEKAATQVQVGAITSSERRTGTLARIEHAADLLSGIRILWVDDHPPWIEPLVDVFRCL